jgi:hypothetical protein
MRCHRALIIAKNGVVVHCAQEEAGKFEVSAAGAALQALSQALRPAQSAAENAATPAEYSQLRVELMAQEGNLRSLRLKLFEQRPAARGGHPAP